MSGNGIRKLGYLAALQGETLLACPFYRASEMPGHTGETIGVWQDKVHEWERGWKLGVRKLERNRQIFLERSVGTHPSLPILLRTS